VISQSAHDRHQYDEALRKLFRFVNDSRLLPYDHLDIFLRSECKPVVSAFHKAELLPRMSIEEIVEGSDVMKTLFVKGGDFILSLAMKSDMKHEVRIVYAFHICD
jgi:hypothetical protein